jgi:hypothetical protein
LFLAAATLLPITLGVPPEPYSEHLDLDP